MAPTDKGGSNTGAIVGGVVGGLLGGLAVAGGVGGGVAFFIVFIKKRKPSDSSKGLLNKYSTYNVGILMR